MQVALIYTTFPNVGEAKAVGRALVEARLVACANILPAMISLYRWEGRIEEGNEVVMLLKTREELADRVIAAVEAMHSYDTPAVLRIDIGGGSAKFIDWICSETDGTGDDNRNQ